MVDSEENNKLGSSRVKKFKTIVFNKVAETDLWQPQIKYYENTS